MIHAIIFLAAASQPRLTRTQLLLIEGARDQLSWGTVYDPSYYKIGYPEGDVPRTKGVCTDVVIRAYRRAGIDLQRLIHLDIVADRRAYPKYPGKEPDTNIDHRRVPNQGVFFRRHGLRLSLATKSPSGWKPGDIVDWRLPNGLNHTGLLTDRFDPAGFPFVIHNIGAGPQEEDVLRAWTVTGHYRYPR